MAPNKEEEKPLKVDKWDGAAVKNALDDSVKKVLVEKYNYVESHLLMDGRLLVCTIAVAFAGFALLWDYLHPFPQSRPILIICVFSYFVMMGVLTLYTSYKEKSVFLQALDKDPAGVDPDNEWVVSSYLKKYDDQYTLELYYQSGDKHTSASGSITYSVASFIDEEGQIVHSKLETHVRQLHDGLLSKKTQ